jgi:hypothetical protein
MKARFAILAAAVAAVLSLTSCDAILEAFYPEFAEGGGEVRGIGIAINLDPNLLTNLGIAASKGRFAIQQTSGRPDIYVAAVPKYNLPDGGFWVDSINGPSARKRFFDGGASSGSPQSYDNNRVNGELKDPEQANYIVIAWIDISDDGNPDDWEPGIEAFWNDPLTYEQRFDFDFSNKQNKRLEARGLVDAFSRIRPELVNAIRDGGAVQELDFDPFFYIEGSQNLDISIAPAATYKIFVPDANAPAIDSIDAAVWSGHWSETTIEWEQLFPDISTNVNDGTVFVDWNSLSPLDQAGVQEPHFFSVDLTVTYVGGTSRFNYLDVFFLDEADLNDGYFVRMLIGDEFNTLAGYFPDKFEADEDYDFEVRIVASSNGWYSDGVDTDYGNPLETESGALLFLNNGYFEDTQIGNGYAYQNGPGFDGLYVVIDQNQNNIIGDAGDWQSRTFPIVLYEGFSNAYVWPQPYDFFPIQ